MSHRTPQTGQYLNLFAILRCFVYQAKCRGEGLSTACPVVRRESSAPPGATTRGEAKVRSVLWVLIEGVAAGVATSGMVSAKKVSIPLLAVVTALAAATVSVAVIGSAA